MSSEAITKTHQAAGIIPAAPWRLRALSVLPEWQLAATFNDGTSGIVDVSMLVHGADAGVFGALRDPAFFAAAYLDCGAVAWPNGADIAPDAMHKEIQRCGTWRILDWREDNPNLTPLIPVKCLCPGTTIALPLQLFRSRS